MTNRPRLYPGHQHQWVELRCDVCGQPIIGEYLHHARLGANIHGSCPLTNVKGEDVSAHAMLHTSPGNLVRCKVCGFQAPRNAAGLDDPLRGLRCQFVDTPLGQVQQCQLDAGHDGDHDYGNAAVRPHPPEQETRTDA